MAVPDVLIWEYDANIPKTHMLLLKKSIIISLKNVKYYFIFWKSML